ncbi:TPA: hypothetical protein SBQ34_000419 [Raoultella ornithinolytica]|uniref:Tail spike TSP1/Gp66 N-terminal domain-containing protein n=1 Tax=Raoultella ornithinolytica TaxID=54291 RepID=A0ABZ2DTB0_RAOOR|nr:hypothetical protein [Raoultella ornithinolytica]HBK4953264.1 hypothetical protein [Raoultella ornithinolytica]HBK6050751.1 hypothetical protein [Raoultella ornithinolytica]HBK6056360.1 hypothetical protein [Raoultella ornithinolytica]HBK6061926.1 hypothetical protein [Raoultella ornithinolytica]
MSTYKTKNPLGSAAVKDLYDNAENVDRFVNDRTKEDLDDRLGVLRKTWYGMEMIFSRFIMYITGRGEQAVGAIGWQELGDWAIGLTVDNRQQIVYYNGSWYKYLGDLEHVIAGDSPANDGGIWSKDNPTGKWSNIGDAALRSNLGSSELPGARLVGLLNGTVNDAVNFLTLEMFGGGPGKSVATNDAAFASVNAFVADFGPCVLNLSGGDISLTKWEIPERLKVVGVGQKSTRLMCGSEVAQPWFVRCAAKSILQWYSSLSDFAVYANGKADYALLLSTDRTDSAVVNSRFESLIVDGGLIGNLVLDGTQNSVFTNVTSQDDTGTAPDTGVLLLNGAAGNSFYGLMISAGRKNLEMRYDASFPGANVFTLIDAPNGNAIYTGVFEKFGPAKFTKTHAVHILLGHSNTIHNCALVVGSVTGVQIDSGNYNEITGNSTFYSSPNVSIPAVINDGFLTKLDNCSSIHILGDSGIYQVVTSNVLRISSCFEGNSLWRVKNTAGNAAGNIRHLDPMWYSGNAANVPPTQLDTGRMTVTAGNQFYIGTPAGVKQVPLYTQRNISTSLMAYTAGTTTNTLSLNYQLTDGYASEITIVVRGNTDRSHRAVIRINAEFTSATMAWYSAQIFSAAYNDTFLSDATVTVNSTGLLTLSLTTNKTITEGDYRLDERILINIA